MLLALSLRTDEGVFSSVAGELAAVVLLLSEGRRLCANCVKLGFLCCVDDPCVRGDGRGRTGRCGVSGCACGDGAVDGGDEDEAVGIIDGSGSDSSGRLIGNSPCGAPGLICGSRVCEYS